MDIYQMINYFKAMGKNEQGFTLIELLVVMLILAILAVIGIVAFANQKDKADDSATSANVSTALKDAKSTTVFADGGEYGVTGESDAATIASAINESNPQLPDAETGTTAKDDALVVNVTSDGELQIYGKSKSGAVFVGSDDGQGAISVEKQ